MNKGIVLFFAILLLTVPLTSAIPIKTEFSTQKNTVLISEEETTIIRCSIDGKQIEKELSITTIQEIIEMGKSNKEDFLTIYDKTKSSQEVSVAFENIRPFFQALVDNGLTDKTVDELNTLYHNIRDKIREPRNKPFGRTRDGAQPTGLWNGVPTPVWGNVACGIFDIGLCAGFAFGTHTIFPTIGADAFITYAFQGESITAGALGGTLATLAFQVLFGFIGVLLATPLIMLGPYFMTGLCGAMFGIGI